MPVELSERELRDAIAVVGEWDREGAHAAQSAFEWMGWEGEEEPLFLRRYDVQVFVWYVLPRKYLAALDDKEAVAAALAKTLERLGGQAAGYAEVCRAPETQRLLRAWEAEDPAAPQTFRHLLDGSGIEPPDTDLLAWGSVMGFEEARVREQVAIALEEAIESGDLVPGSRGFSRRQAEVAKAALREQWDGESERSCLRAVHDERLERWLQRGLGGRMDARRAVLDGIAATVPAEPSAIDPDGARSALEPTRWLLEQGNDGIGLTQTGALNRALVREVAERWPSWWEADLFGPPRRGLLYSLRGARRRADPRRRSGRLRRDARRAGPAGGRRRRLESRGGAAESARRLLAHSRLPAARRGHRRARARQRRIASVARAAHPHRAGTCCPNGRVADAGARACSLDSTLSRRALSLRSRSGVLGPGSERASRAPTHCSAR